MFLAGSQFALAVRSFYCALFLLTMCSEVSYAQITDSAKREDTTRWKSSEIIVTGFPSQETKTPAPMEHVDRSTIHDLHTIQDIPKIIAYTPSAFYYNNSGTDIGYSFLSLRGFDQTRIAVMVNGVPQN